MSVTKNELIETAENIRSKYPEVYGQCWVSSKELLKQYITEYNISKDDIEIEEVRMGKSATIRHYVVAFPAKEVSDTSAKGRILIDITLDQYCEENYDKEYVKTSLGKKEDIPSVVIYETKKESPYTG